MEPEGEVRMMFLKMVGKDAKIFISNEDDVSDVAYANIVSILPNLTLNNRGDRTYYNFTENNNILVK